MVHQRRGLGRQRLGERPVAPGQREQQVRVGKDGGVEQARARGTGEPLPAAARQQLGAQASKRPRRVGAQRLGRGAVDAVVRRGQLGVRGGAELGVQRALG